MVVIKHSFGGLGANWVNPALGGWMFVRFSWPGAFDNTLPGPGLSAGRGMDTLFVLAGSLDKTLTTALNNTVFSLTGSELPEGYIDLLFSSAPGIIADRGLMALLLGTILISASQVCRFWAAPLFLGVYALLVRVFGALSPGAGQSLGAALGEGLGRGDVLYALFSGGTIVAAFILILEPASGAKSALGAALIVTLAGILSFVFRYQGNELHGAFFAILLLNTLAPVIRSLERRGFYNPHREGRPS
jgi:electron transport complex protein RnfD